MAVDDLLISAIPGELRAALFAGGQLVEFHVERAAARSRVGAVFFGRVVGVPKGLHAAFVDFGDGQPGFLPLGAGETRTEGEGVIVQLRRDRVVTPDEEKGARLSAKPELTGRFAVLMPFETGVSVSRKIDLPADRGGRGDRYRPRR